MKKFFIIPIIICIFIFSGCGTSTNTHPSLSAVYPDTYTAIQSGDMLIVSSMSGKIVIGGFTPAQGHPGLNEGNLVFQMITYTKDPKIEIGAIPVALYYRHGDTQTETELLQIMKTVK